MSIVLFLLACTEGASLDSTTDTALDTAEDTATDTGAEPSWSYEGATGPEHWGELSEEWEECSSGSAQSPIDVVTANVVESASPGPVLTWTTTDLNAYNSGHYIRYEVDAGSSMLVDGVQYDLKQFHFHGLSEHTIDGVHFAGEVHFVHTGHDDPDKIAVVAVLFDDVFTGEESAALSPGGPLRFDDALALPESEEPTSLGGTLNLADIGVSADIAMLTYTGSLTTPPCTGGVEFFVSGASLKMPPADVAAFHAVYDFNYRPVQPVNGRVLTVLTVP